MHPIESNPQINGLPVIEFSPVTTGPTNHGPNLFSYSVEDTKLANDSGSIGLSSLSLYRFVFILNNSLNVNPSVASPVSPKNTWSYWYTFSNLLLSPSDWFPSLRSLAMATQSLPTIATTEPPFIVSIASAPLGCSLRPHSSQTTAKPPKLTVKRTWIRHSLLLYPFVYLPPKCKYFWFLFILKWSFGLSQC